MDNNLQLFDDNTLAEIDKNLTVDQHYDLLAKEHRLKHLQRREVFEELLGNIIFKALRYIDEEIMSDENLADAIENDIFGKATRAALNCVSTIKKLSEILKIDVDIAPPEHSGGPFSNMSDEELDALLNKTYEVIEYEEPEVVEYEEAEASEILPDESEDSEDVELDWYERTKQELIEAKNKAQSDAIYELVEEN